MSNALIRRAAFAAAFAVMGLMLAGCSDQPSERDGERVFTALRKNEFGNTPFVVESFTKTNGETQEFMGLKMYTMDYRATVRYPAGRWTECLPGGGGRGCWQIMARGPLAAGSVETVSGKLTFEKTERGWRGREPGNIYVVQP